MQPVVYLIGAGPGDPELLTLKGADALSRCDVVLYDGLSNPEILAHAPGAEQINVGKHGHSRIWKQQEIIEVMLQKAAEGKTVARLKGGDPAVFARTAEEIDALQEAQVPYEVIPGITAALAAGSYAGIPITHRKMASAVALVTGHEEPGKAQSSLDWEALARFPGTLVIYMGVTTAQTWTAALIAAGKDPATPAALVRRCSLPDQRTIRCRLDSIADELTPASKFRPPVIAIIGPVATLAESTLAESMRWVHERPLHGQTLLVTRPADQAESMAREIRRLGGHPLVAPAIAVKPLDDYAELDQAIRRLADGKFDIATFVSANGVEHFMTRVRTQGYDARIFAGVKVAVVGKRTAAALALHGLVADIVPDDFRASGLAESLGESVTGKSILIARASRGSDELPRQLQSAGANVQEVIVYRNVDVSQPDPEIVAALADDRVDWVTVTSSATAVNLHRLYGESLRRCRFAAISPVTAKALNDEGYGVDVIAEPFTVEALLQQIAQSI